MSGPIYEKVIHVKYGDEIIFEGSIREISDKYGVTKNAVYKCVNYGHQLFGMWDVIDTGKKKLRPVDPNEKPKPKPKPKPKKVEKPDITWMLRLLKEYGNVAIKNGADPNWYIEEFKKHGFDCYYKVDRAMGSRHMEDHISIWVK